MSRNTQDNPNNLVFIIFTAKASNELLQKSKENQTCKTGGKLILFCVPTIALIKILVVDITDDIKTLGRSKAPHHKLLYFP